VGSLDQVAGRLAGHLSQCAGWHLIAAGFSHFSQHGWWGVLDTGVLPECID
jgi:hypothetical protein